MKFSDLNGRLLRVISASPWEVLLEEENGGMPGGAKYALRPDEPEGVAPCNTSIELFALREERARS